MLKLCRPRKLPQSARSPRVTRAGPRGSRGLGVLGVLGALGVWGPGVLGSWGSGALGVLGSGALGSWGSWGLGPWGPGVLGVWGPGVLGVLGSGALGSWWSWAPVDPGGLGPCGFWVPRVPSRNIQLPSGAVFKGKVWTPEVCPLPRSTTIWTPPEEVLRETLRTADLDHCGGQRHVKPGRLRSSSCLWLGSSTVEISVWTRENSADAKFHLLRTQSAAKIKVHRPPFT